MEESVAAGVHAVGPALPAPAVAAAVSAVAADADGASVAGMDSLSSPARALVSAAGSALAGLPGDAEGSPPSAELPFVRAPVVALEGDEHAIAVSSGPAQAAAVSRAAVARSPAAGGGAGDDDTWASDKVAVSEVVAGAGAGDAE